MLNITASQTLFSGIGFSLATLGVIFLLVPKRTRFGILTILLSNIPFVTAIVLPKKVSELFLSLGFEKEILSNDYLYHGVGFGVLIFALWYAIRSLFVKLLGKFKKDTKQKEDKTEKLNDESQRLDESVKNPHLEENSKNSLSKQRVEPGFGQKNLANPHLFDNLRLDNLKAKDE